jgi:hypothetical protein
MLHILGPLCAHPAAGRGRRGRSRRTGACTARGDCDPPDAAHTWAALHTFRRRPWQAGAVAAYKWHEHVLGSL